MFLNTPWFQLWTDHGGIEFRYTNGNFLHPSIILQFWPFKVFRYRNDD